MQEEVIEFRFKDTYDVVVDDK